MNKATKKVAEKVGKAKEKIAAKCGNAAKKCALVVALLAFAALIDGCGSYPAAYSVTQSNEFDNCTFTFGGATTITNAVPVEMFTLAQSLENTGTQTADQKTTTDVSPEVAVGVGGSSAGVGQGGGSASGTFSKIGAAVDAASSLFGSDDKTEDEKTKTDCPDGNCSPTGSCEDGNCYPM